MRGAAIFSFLLAGACFVVRLIAGNTPSPFVSFLPLLGIMFLAGGASLIVAVVVCKKNED